MVTQRILTIPIRECAPLCLARTPAGAESRRGSARIDAGDSMHPSARRRQGVLREGPLRQRFLPAGTFAQSAPSPLEMSALLQDLRLALRQLRRRPAFTATAVLTLAIGMGVNAVAFSVVSGLLFKGFATKAAPGVGRIATTPAGDEIG
jgi:hypothetical protein